jgi:glyoxylase-like metal-dependent hydrolase (beta-lactamase superfamily II)
VTNIHRIEIPIPFPIRSVNLYFIKDSFPTLIDAGFYSEDSLKRVSIALENAGCRLSDVKRILLTHGHLDHVGLAGKISKISGAEIFIHPLDRNKSFWDQEKEQGKKIESFIEFLKKAGLPETLMKTISVQMTEHFKRFFPDRFDMNCIRGGETFAFDDFSLEVVPCPGHTSGSVCFFDSKEGRLFSGDHLLEKVTSNAMVEIENQKVGKDYKSLSSYLRSLALTKNMDVALVLPGHGPSFSNHQERINTIESHHRVRREEVLNTLKALGENASTRHG